MYAPCLKSRGRVLYISRYAYNDLFMSLTIQNINIKFVPKLVPGNYFSSFSESGHNSVDIWGITNIVYCDRAIMVVFIPSPVALIHMSCCRNLLCFLGNFIVVCVFIGSRVYFFCSVSSSLSRGCSLC